MGPEPSKFNLSSPAPCRFRSFSAYCDGDIHQRQYHAAHEHEGRKNEHLRRRADFGGAIDPEREGERLPCNEGGDDHVVDGEHEAE